RSPPAMLPAESADRLRAYPVRRRRAWRQRDRRRGATLPATAWRYADQGRQETRRATRRAPHRCHPMIARRVPVPAPSRSRAERAISLARTSQLVTPHVVLLHETIECRAVDVRQPSCARHVSARARRQAREVFLLELRNQSILRCVIRLIHHRHRQRALRRRNWTVIVHWYVRRLDRLSWLTQHRNMFDRVL